MVDFLAAAEYPDPPKFSPPPKVRRNNAAAVNAAEFLKFISRREKLANTSLFSTGDRSMDVRNLCQA